jgi:hypothetical protein
MLKVYGWYYFSDGSRTWAEYTYQQAVFLSALNRACSMGHFRPVRMESMSGPKGRLP